MGGWSLRTLAGSIGQGRSLPECHHAGRRPAATEKFDDVWNTPFRDLLVHILQRFVIRLHLSLAYQKSGSFFFVDEERIRGRGKRYDSPSYGNGRFASAILILRDLNLLDTVPDADELLHRTADGDSLLKDECAEAPRHEDH